MNPNSLSIFHNQDWWSVNKFWYVYSNYIFCKLLVICVCGINFSVVVDNFYVDVGGINKEVILMNHQENFHQIYFQVHVLNLKVGTGNMNLDYPAHFCYSASLALAPTQAYTSISTNLFQCVRSVPDMTPWLCDRIEGNHYSWDLLTFYLLSTWYSFIVL